MPWEWRYSVSYTHLDVYKRQPLDTLREEEGSQKIFDFRDKLEEVLTGGDGSEVLTLTGGATGLYLSLIHI